MTNTNELTAKLKAAGQEALQPHERLSVLPPDDIFDISLAEGTQLDADITAVNAFHDEATPANILALTEALEAAEKRIAELEARTLTVKLPDEVRDENNQFLIVRHPGKAPVIKHPVGEMEDYVLQLFMDDPNATIDIVTHRYYGVGGQWVQCANEYLQEGGIKLQIEGE